MNARTRLTEPERDQLLTLIEICHAIETESAFVQTLAPRVQELFDCEGIVCGVGTCASSQVHRMISVGFPESYLRRRIDASGRIDSPLIKAWGMNKRPRYIRVEALDAGNNARLAQWRDDLLSHRLKSLVGHGLTDIENTHCSYCAMSNLGAGWTDRHEYKFELLLPHLHVALYKLPKRGKPTPGGGSKPLTAREVEVLSWIARGKTNEDIATILGISPWTIKIHSGNIMRKLNASNRGNAVAKGYSQGLIQGP